MKAQKRITFCLVVIALLGWLVFFIGACSSERPSNLRFEISFPESVHSEPITGRAFVVISRNDEREPRLQAGSWRNSVPFFGVDIHELRPGEVAVIDEDVLGYPPKSLEEIPKGDYFVQGLINIYTEFHRADGHVIWAHMDQWEGQQFNRSPGNIYSKVEKVHLDSDSGYSIELDLTEEIPPIEIPPDTEWVKRVKIKSELLSEFWGHPIYLGATILLPKGYDSHPDVYYPVIYLQNHFSLDAPFGFKTEPDKEKFGPYLDAPREPTVFRLNLPEPPPSFRVAAAALGMPETGYEFYKAWASDDFPRVIAVTFQHPTPYFDDSYAVNSVNNGPYGDAIMTELIPYVEENFRILSEPYARVLTGCSTGGWESISLQLRHPDFFGGTWTYAPDPIDFRRYCSVNIYEDANAFVEPGHEWIQPERYFYRSAEGQPRVSMRMLSQMEAALGSKGRSAEQLDIWQATYGPVGEDGYPEPLWDKHTGEIHHQVAEYMRDNGYDLRHYAETHWPEIGPKLVGKIHLICGDMDNYYLPLAVYLMEDFLESTKDPYYAGSFEYGRPMKGHCWTPMNLYQLVEAMAEHVHKNAPKSEGQPAYLYP